MLSSLLYIRTSKRLGLLLVALALLVSACGEAPEPAPQSTCTGPAQKVLTDIQSVVDWINAMPKPVSLPCFVASLPRPLKTYPAVSTFSAQPSLGERSPRVFFFFDKLVLTVAVDQDEDKTIPAELETHLLELSFLVDEATYLSQKGEIKFPVMATLADDSPFLGIMFSDKLTTCSLCHPNEQPHRTIGDGTVYASTMLRPTDATTLNNMKLERAQCDENLELHRCSMLAAIVDHGTLQWWEFPIAVPTIFDN